MALETFNYLDSLVPTNPDVNDGLVNGDDHIRGIKLALKQTFPNVTGPITPTQAQINALASLLVNGVLKGNGAAPAGLIADFGGTTAPAGWLACDGTAVSRTTYPDLWAAIGTTWGAGDGSTTFNLPNLSDRFRRHRNAAGFAGAVGTYQGSQNLSHTHGVSGNTGVESSDHTHAFSGTTGIESNDHTHQVSIGAGATAFNQTGGGSFAMPTSPSTVTSAGASAHHTHAYNGTTQGISVNHTHAFNVTSTTGSADGNEARPLSATVLTCIKVS